jgi:hypothetical protein
MFVDKFAIKSFVFSLFLVSSLSLQAQSASIPLLERRISLTVVKQPAEKILKQISEQAGCVFSYSAQLVNVQNVSTVEVTNKPVKVVLDDIFGNKVDYKVRGKYIILKKGKEIHKSTEPKIVEGYIYDKQTGRQLTEASIYDKESRLSAITNQYGYFRIEVPQSQLASSLYISKAGYSDTLLLASTLHSYKKMMELTLNTNDAKQEPIINFKKFLPKWLLPHKIDVHSTNLTDSLFRKVQLSLIPMVNTNALLTGNTINDWSINLTVGYVYAIQKCELGGIINIVRTNAGVCQLAGLGNIVGGNSSGFQAAGGFNKAHNAFGVQSAGGINIVNHNANIQIAGGANRAEKANVQLAAGINLAKDTAVIQVSGAINVVSNYANVQTAGSINIARNANAQISGAVNLAKDSNIVQVSGAINIANKTVVQVSAAVNVARNASFLQLASGINYASKSSNMQIAGFANKAKTTNVQIATINIAKRVKALQLGIVNLADSCSGTPIGFFSYVRSGYHHLEVSIDEASFASATFRSGVQRFHTSFSAGVLIKQLNDKLFSYGFGLGTSLGNPRKYLFDIDLSTNKFVTAQKLLSDGYQFKLYCGIDRKLTRYISLAAGVSCNVLLNKTTSPDDQLIYSQLVPYSISNRMLSSDTQLRSWAGGKIALRFW